MPMRLLMNLPIQPPINMGKNAVNMMPMEPKFRLINWLPVLANAIKPTTPISAPLTA